MLGAVGDGCGWHFCWVGGDVFLVRHRNFIGLDRNGRLTRNSGSAQEAMPSVVFAQLTAAEGCLDGEIQVIWAVVGDDRTVLVFMFCKSNFTKVKPVQVPP